MLINQGDLRVNISGHFMLVYMVLLLLIIGCSSHKSLKSIDLMSIPNDVTEVRSSTLGVGDVVEVRVYREAELSGLYRIDENGGFVFPLIGFVNAKMKSTVEISTEIVGRLQKGYIRTPHVTVILKESNSKKIFILGKVKKPGSYTYEDRMSIVQAVAVAGGLSSIASQDLILIRTETGKEKRYIIPFKEISQGRSKNILLKPSDILFVPESIF